MLHTIHDTAILAVDFNIQPTLPPGADGLLRLVNWLLWIIMLACVAALVVSGGKFAWEKWSQGQTGGVTMLLGSLIGTIVAGSATTILNAVTAA
ncbi:MAG: hypothetical protein WAW17_33375 [Rhodococcus sp. (in: high G+C Gram-positive bacteria)]|uniref:hypothetical protein n=1 Tax=Rhodococcus sp. TaxID=1831 RepID=UPI003BB1F2B4